MPPQVHMCNGLARPAGGHIGTRQTSERRDSQRYNSTTGQATGHIMPLLQLRMYCKIKVKKGRHTPNFRRSVGGVLVSLSHGRWARRWIKHHCLWRMASATPDLRLPFQHKLVLIAPTHKGMARLSWPGWLVIYRDSLPARRRSSIQVLTGPSVE